jgi:delta(3,5)-delta(2,4)-dienoyl-CoA isomerase
MSNYDFETLAVVFNVEEPTLLEVAINRPAQLNAMNNQFWADMTACMEKASADADVHCILLHGGSCRIFTAGLDLKAFGGSDDKDIKSHDVSRRALRSDFWIAKAQAGITSIERCNKPVVVALHNGVIGGGVDLACACDIRYCSEDTFFSIAEVNIGITADVGTLQRLPKIVGNDSVVRELALTGRRMMSAEAKSLGLVGAIFPDQEQCLTEARKVAKVIASKSPIAVIGTKASLNYSRDHTVQEGLDHVRLWNTLHLQSQDVKVAVKATLTKSKATFSRL